jgi:CMP-N-acetylneuraminic acid synthetase
MKNKIFVPIKHESERVPGKNFRFLGEEPLWKRLLLRLKSDTFEIFVNTDSPDILENDDERFKQVTFTKRKPELCGHEVPVNSILLDFVNEYCQNTDRIVQVHVTSPFIELKSVLHAFNMLEAFDSIATVDRIQARGWRGFDLENRNHKVPINHDPRELRPTQQLEPIYIENSLIYGFNVSPFLSSGGNRMCKKTQFIPTGFPENVDIDTEDDFHLASILEQVYKGGSLT